MPAYVTVVVLEGGHEKISWRNCLPVFSLRLWPDIGLDQSSLFSHGKCDHTLCGGQNEDIAIITLYMLFKEGGGGTNLVFLRL
jgi:hypothetical protein